MECDFIFWVAKTNLNPRHTASDSTKKLFSKSFEVNSTQNCKQSSFEVTHDNCGKPADHPRIMNGDYSPITVWLAKKLA